MTVPVYAEWGPLLLTTDIDRAVIGLLQTWLPMYISRFEQERGLAPRTFARPKPAHYFGALTDAEFPDRTMPAIVVTASQTAATPEKDGNDNYYASWLVTVSCVCRGQNPQNTRDLASTYEACVRRVMLQQCLRESYPDGPVMEGETRWAATPIIARVTDRSGQGRYLAAGIGRYTAYLDKAVQAGVGPNIPNDPYPDPDPSAPDAPSVPLVPVTAVTSQVNAVPLTEEIP